MVGSDPPSTVQQCVHTSDGTM